MPGIALFIVLSVKLFGVALAGFVVLLFGHVIIIDLT
jgi:hypothetical protein